MEESFCICQHSIFQHCKYHHNEITNTPCGCDGNFCISPICKECFGFQQDNLLTVENIAKKQHII